MGGSGDQEGPCKRKRCLSITRDEVVDTVFSGAVHKVLVRKERGRPPLRDVLRVDEVADIRNL